MISDDAVARADATGSGKGLVKGFATIDHVALINVEGTGMARPVQHEGTSVHGIGFRVFFSVALRAAPSWVSAEVPWVPKFSEGWLGKVDEVLLRVGARLIPRGVQVGVPGTVSAIFSTVRDASANVIMISQASSEHSVCFAVKQTQGEQAVAALNARFAEAIRAGRISKVEKIDNCCVLAAVGRQMASRKGVAATMFSALAKANINIRRARALH